MRIVWLLLVLKVLAVHASEIHDVTKKGDVARLKILLAENKSLLETPDISKKRPIHFAAEFSTEALKVLIDAGASVHSVDNMNYPPIFYASNSRERTEMLERAGADIKQVVQQKLNGDWETYIHFAATQEAKAGTLQLALARGLDVNGKTPKGIEPNLRPIDLAAIAGVAENVEFLIKHGATIAKGNGSSSPLEWAASRNRAEVVAVLLKHGANPNDRNDSRMTALFWCAMPGGGPETAKLLLEAKADPNPRVEGTTPLGWNIKSLKSEKDPARRKKREALSELLIKYGGVE